MTKENGTKKEKPNQRKIAFRLEAINALVEISDEDLVTFEKAMVVSKLDCQQCRLHDTTHNPKHRHQNCRDNPFCINRLGLEKFEKLINAELQNRDDARKDQTRRDLNDQPCGLVNAGNFCYINSFLQVWFNVLEFRQIVYNFRPSDSFVPPQAPRMDVQATMMALQDLFFTLQTSPFYDTDKTNQIVKLLRLNSEQQDSQEFTVKFFNALERCLPEHPNGNETLGKMKDIFTGTICTRMYCKCGMKKEREESALNLALNIEGHSTLAGALDAYFGVEKLDDYTCSQCNKKGNVSKECDYVSLPPVIVIQLNRYKFTPKGRQKLKNTLHYPREIPALAFQRTDQTKPPPAKMYDLFAVTIHEGNNAECGHYYDLIKSPLNQKWYRYNDESVEPLQKPPGTEKGAEAAKGKKKEKEKIPSDLKACYGLLYRRRDRVLPLPTPQLPPEELVGESRKMMEESFDGQTKRKIEKSEKRLYDLQRRVDKLKNAQSKLETHEGKYKNPNEVAFIPTSLFTNILEQEYEVAKGEKRKKKTSHSSNGDEKKDTSEVQNDGDVDESINCDMENTLDVSMESVEVTPDQTDVDLLALAMTSSELPIIEGSNEKMKTRGQPKYVYERNKSPKKTPSTHKPVSTRVAALLKEHEMPICPHGKMPIDTILFGDVKAVARAPAIALLREYDFRAKIVYDNGHKEFPTPEKDREVFVFTADDICMECVKEMRREGLFTKRLEDDDRMVKRILKDEKVRCSVKGQLPRPSDHFYVAKYALTNFKKAAIAAREEKLKQAKGGSLVFDSIEAQKVDPDYPSHTLKRLRGRPRKDENEVPEKMMKIADENGCGREYTSTELPDNVLEEDEVEPNGVERQTKQRHEFEEEVDTSNGSMTAYEFNSELRCSHDGINFSQFRLSVSPEEWDSLKYYFENCFEVKCSDDVCDSCRQIEVDAQHGSENMRVLVKEMRRRISEMIKKVEGREGKTTNEDGDDITFGICSIFMDKLKKLSSRVTSTAPRICQSCLICSHGKPYKGFCNDMEEKNSKDAHIVGLTEEEWTTFVNEITNLDMESDEKATIDVPTPIRIVDSQIADLCVMCFDQHVRMKEEEKYMFDNENIYVKLVNPSDEEDVPKPTSKSRRRQKNLITVKLSSSAKLLDLKVALYEKCYQMPSDQLLYRHVGGDVFDNGINEKTLFELKILPNNSENPLILIAQQTNQSSTSDDGPDHRAPERGFVDSALAH